MGYLRLLSKRKKINRYKKLNSENRMKVRLENTANAYNGRKEKKSVYRFCVQDREMMRHIFRKSEISDVARTGRSSKQRNSTPGKDWEHTVTHEEDINNRKGKMGKGVIGWRRGVNTKQKIREEFE